MAKIVIDKFTENITLEKRQFMLIRKQQVIPFSSVNAVRIEWTITLGGPASDPKDAWEASIIIGRKKYVIERATNKHKMLNLAHRISKLMKRELQDNSEKPGPKIERQF